MSLTRRALGGGLAAGLAAPAIARAYTPLPDVEVPFQVDGGGLPWTGVWLNKQGPFRFAIASGTNSFMLWEPIADKLGLTAKPLVGASRLEYDWRYSVMYEADELLVGGGYSLTHAEVAGFRTDEAPTNVGYAPLLPDRTTTFDFQRGIMRSLKDARPDTAGFQKAELVYNRSFLAWTPLVEARLGGKLVRLRVDTGRPDAVRLFPDAVDRLGLWEADVPFYDRTVEAGAAQVVERTTRRDDLEIGATRLARPPVRLIKPETAILRRWGFDGFIGMDVLKRYDLVIDQPKRNLWMRPTAVMDHPWRQDRAGFDVRGDRVTVVDPGSPAEAAGLQAGDVLVTKPAGVLAARFAPAGAQMAFDITRGGARRHVAITLADRI